MSEKIIEKLDQIEAKQIETIEAVKADVEVKLAETVTTFEEKVAALEAKVASINATPVIKTYKTIAQEVNRSVKEQLKGFYEKGGKVEKELKMFEDVGQYDAYIKEASALTGSGAGVGGRTAYDPVFVALRLANPMRGVSRSVATDGATYQFRAKTGNAGAAWGYAIQNNGAATTEDTNIWQLTLQDLNVQFPIRTAALDDIDGLESNVVSDMLLEFSQQEGLSMIQNNDQGSTSLPYGGSNGLRGLNQYPGSNATFTGGTISTAAYGTSGTGSTSGLHSIATYDQLTSNTNSVTVNNVTYKDIVNFIYALPQEYWSPDTKFVINPIMLGAIRGLTDTNGRPIYVDGLAREDGIVGSLLGFDVVVNKYLDTPNQTATGAAGTTSKYPMYFGDWTKFHTIVDRLNMVMRRYDQTLPGYITFYGEKRLATSVVNPFSGIRYRTTATANA
ncbi:phage major capsid protein [bacterium]|nr:phage major capsid protein [bacterium]